METIKMKVRFTLLTEMLGTLPADPEIFESYIASKAPDDVNDEGNGVDETEALELKGTTIFRRDEETGSLYIPDYMIKGCLKSRGEALRRANGTGAKTKGYGSIKSKVNDHVHVYPRKIMLGVDKADSILERSLRADTAQGPRVSLARSEVIAAGRSFECEILARGVITEKMLREMLAELEFYGIGQWRNAGYGRCEIEVLGVEGGKNGEGAA